MSIVKYDPIKKSIYKNLITLLVAFVAVATMQAQTVISIPNSSFTAGAALTGGVVKPIVTGLMTSSTDTEKWFKDIAGWGVRSWECFAPVSKNCSKSNMLKRNSLKMIMTKRVKITKQK